MGLPQGSILGPMLFSLFINYLPSSCPDLECQIYADDTVIYTSAKSSAKVVVLLSEQMEKISKWLQENNLTLNVKTTVFMCFSNRKKIEKVKIRVFNEEIEEVTEVRFLGVVLDSQLKFDKHIKGLSKIVKINLNCFKLIRHYIMTEAAHLFLHSMFFFSYLILYYSLVSN